ncbi:hypothetical protein F4821DRAFT_263027 [Hypoxylon rubiginosum]|uniref:Uncharacterized protein n=1 Tax=Hypoxylon rubiginosum TaxID=110542 RepID=A0ACC0CS96_9PEZI|nr:hypothetical protein F4821DRAFT_263027 [Hypoxylon rubiginosum]
MSQPPFNFSSFPDIRDKYPGDLLVQGMYLESQVPSSFNHHLSTDGEVLVGNAVSAFVCILRHLFSHVNIRLRGDPTHTKRNPELHRQIRDVDEVANPLLRFAWSYFGSNRDSLLAQNSIMEDISKYLLEGNFGIRDLSFLSLMESPLMHQTLLQRDPFLLYDPHPLSQPIEDDTDWEVDDGRNDPVGLAKRSLITWHGQGDLGDFIANRFRTQTNTSTNRRYIWTFHNPAIIRVHYHAPATNSPRFPHLKDIRINARLRLKKSRSTVTIGPPETPMIFVLVAVVRLRLRPNDKDMIRRYSTDGSEVITPSDYSHTESNWKLGEPGRQFMLYYTERPKEKTGLTLGETAWVSPGSAENLRDAGNWFQNATVS